ncbi:MAG: hypothetical protein LUE98_14405 [Tannerellaceae bacterium]|nr:hypothetical protein [Tannerellaceae bacterium]
MKPGAWMRICVPGLQEVLQLAETDKYSSLAEAIYQLTQNYGHVSVWDERFFKEICESIGFVNVYQTSFMQGNDKRLLKDSPHRAKTSLYMEAQKPKDC